tara:strand:+ start:78 stop:995 length:918 start_codon:yes stop_codon:yes gene_type:complete
MSKFSIYNFYRFVNIENKIEVKKTLDSFFEKKLVRGTILLADEGINASIAGEKVELDNAIKLIKKIIKFKKMNFKANSVNYLPFNKLKIRLKNEIVTIGVKGLSKFNGNYVSPAEWDKLIADKKTKIVDVRNKYEIDIGTFKNAIDPQTNNFRNFPKQFSRLKLHKEDVIGIFCTGGIRCEKAAGYLLTKGFKKVYQLQGGIINYLDYKKISNTKTKWTGECFVFDNRVSINANLEKGSYHQCYGCRSPITNRDIQSKNYKKGVYCPNCYKSRSKKQIKSSQTRQNQIELNKYKNIKDKFQKIYS